MSGPEVVLVGAMGAGKTTVGGLVAAALGLDFLDTDHLVESAAGKPVAEIFVDDGEEHFRELEQAAVARALASHEGVLALGGGAVLEKFGGDSVGETRRNVSGYLDSLRFS